MNFPIAYANYLGYCIIHELLWLSFYPDFSSLVFSMFYTRSPPFLLYLKLKRIIHSIPHGLQNLPSHHNCGQIHKDKTWCDDAQKMLVCSATGPAATGLYSFCSFPTTVLVLLVEVVGVKILNNDTSLGFSTFPFSKYSHICEFIYSSPFCLASQRHFCYLT